MKSAIHINPQQATLNIRGRLIDLSTPKVMGILNVTPDSFYDGNRFTTESAIARQTEKMLKEGATFIDIGGYSSRPGAEDISESEELTRTVKVISFLSKEFPTAILSIDTFRSEVARQTVAEGASMINDISGGEADQKMFATVAKLQAPYILMHMRGTPQTMTRMTVYENFIKGVADYFHQKISVLESLGAKDVIIDPGFGFAKNGEQNFNLLNNLNYFKVFSKPIMAGLSRKSMIWKTLDTSPEEALNGTTALNMTALLKGASILRVHDVKETIDTIKLYTNVITAR